MIKSFELFEQENSIDYQKFEKYRIQTLKKRRLNNSIAILNIIILLGLGVFFMLKMRFIISVFLLFAGVIIPVLLFLRSFTYKAKFKSLIFNHIFPKIAPSYKYVVRDEEINQIFKEIGFKYFGRAKLQDCFHGIWNGKNFKLSIIRYEIYDNSNGNINFQGLFAFLKTTTNQYPHTVIVPNKQDAIGDKDKRKKILKKIKTNDTDFDKLFSVWTKDQNFATKILNSQLKKFLLKLIEKYPFIGFRDNIIALGLNDRRKAFHIRLNKPFNRETLEQLYNDLQYYIEILEQMLLIVFAQ